MFSILKASDLNELTKEVNCTEAYPSVRVSWSDLPTSKTESNMSTVRGKSSLMAMVALKLLDESLQTMGRPRMGHSMELIYSDQFIRLGGGGGKDSFRGNSSPD
jgi:hypothetical protein